ncbi:FIST N-terminal domain-containing protein [Primorskyibacter marinus]|uniref:FIST N-terminal domain-containing protein n=1 Tax=Primorskyibacter marinus TaxID=1977320 RepID=UPI001E3F54BE|nr:FIST N-terminal domain-containing protein [Primorskyibacter marinus]
MHAALRSAQVDWRDPDALESLHAQLGAGEFAFVGLFVTPEADFAAVVAAAQDKFTDTCVCACTTAGELGSAGYEDGQIVAVGLPAAHFATASYVIDDLHALEPQAQIDRLIQTRMALSRAWPRMSQEFAFVMIDGLSLAEEHLTSVLSTGLGPVPLFGGSAGDGTRFSKAWLACDGVVSRNSAVITLVRTTCPVRVFSLDHLMPTDRRMVVTGADPARRIVHEINAEPAAQEYARLLGKDPQQLDPFTFAAHPVVVRLGESHHVRAIQRVDEDGNLVFFSAINEGMVLTLADHQDMAEHLERGLAELAVDGAPDQILGCDCILRRIEAGQTQKSREISRILSENRVVGFGTYGEQIGGLHVNQTFTGVAIYPPATES